MPIIRHSLPIGRRMRREQHSHRLGTRCRRSASHRQNPRWGTDIVAWIMSNVAWIVSNKASADRIVLVVKRRVIRAGLLCHGITRCLKANVFH